MAIEPTRPPKRRKPDGELQHPDGDIRGAFELHNLLRFKQSTDPEVKTGKLLAVNEPPADIFRN